MTITNHQGGRAAHWLARPRSGSSASPRHLRGLAFLLFRLMSTCFPLHAASTLPDLKARLLKKPLYLRGLWRDDSLQFDARGMLIGSSGPTSFTVAGIEITRVELKPDRLELEGRRIGVVFPGGKAERVVLKGKSDWGDSYEMRLQVAAPANGDYSPALDAVFATDLADLVPSLPIWWQTFAKKSLVAEPDISPRLSSGQTTPALNAAMTTPDVSTTVPRVGGQITPPKVLSMQAPKFSAYARALKVHGNCLIYLQVDEQGSPSKLAILRPVGLGLDEQALLAVQSYRFQPARMNGKPVRVEMNVEVNFDIY